MGLLTLAICRDYGLEMKRFDTHEWVDIEVQAPAKPCFVLFAGESLSRLTGGHFKAVYHRVYTTSVRFSCPFFLRSPNDALLDMNALRSATLQELLQRGEIEQLAPITVSELNKITRVQHQTGGFPPELGQFKQDPYWRDSPHNT